MKEKILFDHFLEGISLAANDLYDLHPLVCKKFSRQEVTNLFRQFESKVCEDPFWEKSDDIMFIKGKGKLEKLDLQGEDYYILNGQYCTDTAWNFFNATRDSWFCPVSQATPLFESYDQFYEGTGICLRYLALASRFFKYYGEESFMKGYSPHTEILKSAIVDIFELKKFPENIIRTNKLESLVSSITYALEHEECGYYIEKANEYLEIAKTVCPELEKDSTYQEIVSLKGDFEKIMERVVLSGKTLCETIIPKVKVKDKELI